MSKISISRSQLKTINQSRKKHLNYEDWQDPQAKKFRQSGLPYVGRNGQEHDAIACPNPEKVCGSDCNLVGCWLLPDRKMELWEDFWREHADNYNRQQSILSGLIDISEDDNGVIAFNRNKTNWKYFLKSSDGRKVLCCKQTFLNLFQVSKKRIENLQKHIKSGRLSFEDRRGLQPNPQKLSDERKTTILDHIKSYPTYISHYSRGNEDPEKKYLDPSLNITRMYDDYCKMVLVAEGADFKPECLQTYRQVFLQTGLKFGLPKTDTCNVCDKLHQQQSEISPTNLQAIRNIKAEIERHQAKAKSAYAHLKADTELSKASNNVVTLCVDLQQVLYSPKISPSDCFYRSKLSSYNFAVTNVARNESEMFFWNETDGKRGQIEISSIIYKYIVANYNTLEPGQERVLNVWSDRCPGQNNNYQNIFLFKYLTLKGYFTQVNQKFLVTGHSFLPCDRHFALIEKCVRRSETSIKAPSDYVKIISNCRRRNPFKVTQLTFQDFNNFDVLRNLFPKPVSMKLTQYHVITSDAVRPSAYLTKETHDTVNPTVHRIDRDVIPNVDALNLDFPLVYFNPLVLPARKVADLKSLLGFLQPMEREEWYKIIPSLNPQRPPPRPNAMIVNIAPLARVYPQLNNA